MNKQIPPNVPALQSIFLEVLEQDKCYLYIFVFESS